MEHSTPPQPQTARPGYHFSPAGDGDFYADNKVGSGGLAPELAAELTGKPHRLKIMAHLSDLLTEVRVDYDISAEAISAQVMRD